MERERERVTIHPPRPRPKLVYNPDLTDVINYTSPDLQNNARTAAGMIKSIIRQTREEGKPNQIVRGTGEITFHRDANMDFNDYKPCQTFPFLEKPLGLVTVHSEFGKNIIGIQFLNRVGIYEMEFKRQPDKCFYTLKKIQDFSAGSSSQNSEWEIISSISISPTSTLLSMDQKDLTYAVSTVENRVIKFIKQNGQKEFIHEVATLSPVVTLLEGHRGGVTKVAIDVDRGQYMASLSDDAVCIIWDLDEMKSYTEVALASPGVDCLWHKAEKFKLLIVEREGKIRMFNILKNCSIYTFNTLATPIYSADWAPTNSMLVAVGANKSAYLFDIAVLNSEPGTRIETHLGATNAIKFSTTSSQHFATGSFFHRSEVKVFHQNFRNFVWCQKRESFQSIAWLYGTPILLALSGTKLLVYESSLV